MLSVQCRRRGFEIKVTYADGTALGRSYLNISTDGGTSTSYGTSSQDGVFSLYLPDGKYKIYSVTVNDTRGIFHYILASL